MKKISFILLTFLFVALVSCNEEVQTEQNDFNNLKEQLIRYNDNNIIESSSINGKSFLGWVGTIAATVAGDVIGAAETMAAAGEVAAAAGVVSGGTGAVAVEVVAGVVGAAGGSYIAYNSAAKNSANKVNNSCYIVDLEFSSIYDDLSNAGNMHNDLLEKSYFNGEVINDWIQENYPTVEISDMNKIFNSNSWNKLYSHIEQNSNDYKNGNYDYEILISGSRSAGYLTKDLSDFYELFFDAYTKAESFDKLVDVVKDYSQFVISSDISEKDKRTILFSLDVAVKSPVFWANK